jgi:hypothetical protein
MQEVRDRVRLVDASEIGAQEIQAIVRRAEVEDVLTAKDGEPELVIDVARPNEAETHTLRLACDPRELEELLRRVDGESITLTLDASELERVLEADFAAHGMRERAVVLAIAATTAATGAGVAQAAHYQPAGGSQTATAAAATGGVTSEREWPVGAAAAAPTPAATHQGVVSEREWPVGAAAAAPAEAATNQGGVVSEREWPVGAAAAAPDVSNQGVVSEREWPVGAAAAAPDTTNQGVISEREWPVAVNQTAAQAPAAPSATSGTSVGTDAATAAAAVGGAALLITAAGFTLRRQRKAEPRPA